MLMNWFIDAHEDLAWNIACFRRDYSKSVFETRQNEIGTGIPAFNGDTMLGWPEYNQARVALVFGTLFAIPDRPVYQNPLDHQIFHTPKEANKLYWNQLGLYSKLCDENPQAFRLIHSQTDLQTHLTEWMVNPSNEPPAPHNPVGIIPLMEGADGILSPDELSDWWQAGLRIIGPAWAGNRFCGGTHEPGSLTQEGKALLASMAELGFILDLSHMDAQAAFECLNLYPGTIITSHANASRLVKGYSGNRLLDNDMILAMIERDVVIGVVPFNNFLLADWAQNGGRAGVSLGLVVEQVDYICQMAGDCDHVGIGTDFDGGFGLQSTPRELDSIADLPKIIPLLEEKGYSESQISQIAAKNFHRVLEFGLPK